MSRGHFCHAFLLSTGAKICCTKYNADRHVSRRHQTKPVLCRHAKMAFQLDWYYSMTIRTTINTPTHKKDSRQAKKMWRWEISKMFPEPKGTKALPPIHFQNDGNPGERENNMFIIFTIHFICRCPTRTKLEHRALTRLWSWRFVSCLAFPGRWRGVWSGKWKERHWTGIQGAYWLVEWCGEKSISDGTTMERGRWRRWT